MEQVQGQYDEKSRPLSMGQYIVMFIIQIIPIVNLIMLFIWAFSNNTNLNKKNYSRAMLIVLLVVVILYLIIFLILGRALLNSY
jgi:NADH:ubiquinone oxidoreductase subunit 3 (subunit A)